jgi:hypothetical protein
MKNKATLALSLLASLVLTACGGGGGGSSSAATPSSSSASSPTAASTPAAASAPAAASTPASTPAVNGESLPSLSSPQPGSTAATGNGLTGIWSVTSSINKTTAFIDPQNDLSYLSTVGTIAMSEFFGVLTPTTSSWTLASGGQFQLAFYYTASAGTGSFTANNSFTGSYVANGTTTNLSWTYDPANALAVTQSSVAGTWTETNTSLTISSSGALSGTMSNCPVTGTMMLATSGSSQNLYTLNVTTGTGSSCQIPNTTLSGNAAIVFLPIANSSLYARSILYVNHSANNSGVAYGQVTLAQ